MICLDLDGLPNILGFTVKHKLMRSEGVHRINMQHGSNPWLVSGSDLNKKGELINM